METQSIKKSLTKVALLSALGVSGMTAMTLNQTTASADTRVDATHIKVDAGDSLYKIAQNHDTTVAKLAADNHIANPNVIHAGDVLDLAGQDNQVNQTTQAVANAQTVANNQQAPVANQQTPATTQNNYSTAYTSNPNYSTTYASNTQPAAGVQSNANVNYGGGNYTSSVSGSEADAKAWIAARESGGNYNARNGQYVGKFQLSASYLNGDYSPANQERVADSYVASRYGSWQNAKAHWTQVGWY